MARVGNRSRRVLALRLSSLARSRGCGFSPHVVESHSSRSCSCLWAWKHTRSTERCFPAPTRCKLRPFALAVARCARVDCIGGVWQQHSERLYRSFSSVRIPCAWVVGIRLSLADLLAWRQHGGVTGNAPRVDVSKSAEDSSSGSHRRICCASTASHGGVLHGLWRPTTC